MPRDGLLAALGERAVFAAHFVRAPLTTASVTPSSPALAAAMADAAAAAMDRADPVVVELGAGSGAFTRAIAERMPRGGRQLAVEISPALASRLAGRAPGVEVVVGDVATLPELLARHGISRADVVVSGLGWSATRPGREDSLLATVADGLAADGSFVQFSYTWTHWARPSRALVAEMYARFTEVTDSPVVWRNLPPAVVHHARGPRRAR